MLTKEMLRDKVKRTLVNSSLEVNLKHCSMSDLRKATADMSDRVVKDLIWLLLEVFGEECSDQDEAKHSNGRVHCMTKPGLSIEEDEEKLSACNELEVSDLKEYHAVKECRVVN